MSDSKPAAEASSLSADHRSRVLYAVRTLSETEPPGKREGSVETAELLEDLAPDHVAESDEASPGVW